MKIRQARSSEATRLVDDLWLPLAREMAELDARNTLIDEPRTAAIEYHEAKLKQENYCAFLAVAEDSFVGLSSGEIQPSAPVFQRGATLKISEVYVRDGWRQQGIASDLLEALEAWGDEKGYETAAVSLNVNNTAAEALYESQGFEPRRLTMMK